MSEAVKASVFPRPKFFSFEGRSFIQYGVSPIRLASLRDRTDDAIRFPHDASMQDGVEYVYDESGNLVSLADAIPPTMETFTLTKDTVITKEQADRLHEFASRPIEFDEDCPELTDDQIHAVLEKAHQRKAAADNHNA